MKYNITKERYLEICDLAYNKLQEIMQLAFTNTFNAKKLYFETIYELKDSLTDEEFMVFTSKLFFPSNRDFLYKVKNTHYGKQIYNLKIYRDKHKQISMEQKLFGLNNNICPAISDKINPKIQVKNIPDKTKNYIVSNVFDLYLETLFTFEKGSLVKENDISFDFYIMDDKVCEYINNIRKFFPDDDKKIIDYFYQLVHYPFSNKIKNHKKRKGI